MKVQKILNIIIIVLTIYIIIFDLTGCDVPEDNNRKDVITQIQSAGNLVDNQPTPRDIDYSLERYNLIRRTYWVNGQREKANALPCPIEKPFGYILLFTESGDIVGKFIVDGKVSSLNSFLTPDSEYYEYSGGSYSYKNEWLADVDGSYGENDDGIFFFTPEGNYLEWTGIYLYSDIPFEIGETLVQ